jgi:hypothetical protein
VVTVTITPAAFAAIASKLPKGYKAAIRTRLIAASSVGSGDAPRV